MSTIAANSTMNAKKGAHLMMGSLAITLFVYTGIGWSCLALFENPVRDTFGCTSAQFSMIITLASLFHAITAIFVIGPVLNKIGVRKYYALCCTTITLVYLIYFISPNIYVMWIAAVIQGFSFSGLSTSMINIMINKWYLKHRARQCSIIQGFSGIGSMVFAALFGQILLHASWRVVMLITIVIFILAGIVAVFLYKGDPDKLGCQPMYADEEGYAEDEVIDTEATGITMTQALKTKQFWFLAITYLLCGIVDYSIRVKIPVLAEDFGYDIGVGGTMLSVCLAAQAISFFILGPIVDKKGSKWGVILTLLALIISAVMLLISKTLFALAIVSVLTGFASTCSQLPMPHSAREAFGTKDFASKAGMMTGLASIGCAVGPVLTGIAYDVWGGNLDKAYIIIIVVCIVGCLTISAGVKPVKELLAEKK